MQVPRNPKVTYLGHDLHEDIFSLPTDKCVANFNRQCNMFFSDFKYANTHIRNELFQKYCTSFLVVRFFLCIPMKWKAYTVHGERQFVWRVPYSTHCNILPYLANCMEIELLLAKRCIKFIDTMCKNDNKVVRTITQMGLLGSYSVIGANKRYLLRKFQFDICYVNACWGAKFNEELQL